MNGPTIRLRLRDVGGHLGRGGELAEGRGRSATGVRSLLPPVISCAWAPLRSVWLVPFWSLCRFG